jgi:hypothetical protein
MSKFNQKLNEVYFKLLEADAPTAMPQDGGPTDPNAAPATPAAPTAPAPAPEEPQQMTPEGKVFLVELALKALAVDSSTISEQDKAIFETKVTKDNAEQVAQRIREIVEGT